MASQLIGVSHLIASGLSLDEFFTQAQTAGYEAVELCLRKEGELTLQTSPAARREVAARAKAAGLPVVSMTHGQLTGNLLDSGAAQRKGIEETVAGLQFAADLGAGCTLHTLGRLRADLFYDDAYRNGVASLREIAVAAERLKVVLAVEFVWSGFLFSPLEMKRFLEEVGSPWIGFYFDPGNMAVFQFPQHWARILGPHIKMMHLKDWQGGPLNGGWPALRAGQVDFAAVNRELRAAGYAGPLISEVDLRTASLAETAKAIREIREL